MINPRSIARARRSMALALMLGLATPLAACGPDANAKGGAKDSSKAAAKAARKCPDPNLRDQSDPCAADYLAPYKPRSSRERF